MHLHSIPNNLPLPLSSFIGREREITEVKRLLTNARLVTLTGVGGCGKTRLALQVAMEVVDACADGIWWVELAALSDPMLVPQAVLKALDLSEQLDYTSLESLLDYFQSKHALLVLDNCEHLIDACAQLATGLLLACPHLTILATSREAMNIDGEFAWIVPSLQVPSSNDQSPLSDLETYDAIRLFIERATSVQSDFKLTKQSAISVVKICRGVDGIPLAIELAAARVKVLSVQQIAERLADAMRLLSAGKRTAPPRHQTLHATMDWSYELLIKSEKKLFRQLSVFAGGFTLAAAQAVCVSDRTDGDDVLELLTNLIGKSLVLKQEESDKEHNTESRYHMLEPIRDYAREKLAQTGDSKQLCDRHLDFFLALSETLTFPQPMKSEAVWREQLEMEHANFRAALAWSIERYASQTNGPARVEKGLHLAIALAPLWEGLYYFSEGSEWLARLLAANQEGASLQRAQGFYLSGFIAREMGNLEHAAALAEQSLALGYELDDAKVIASALKLLGIIRHSQGGHEQAMTKLGESVNLFRELGDERGIASTLVWLADAELRQGRIQQAAKDWRESLLLFKKIGDEWGVTSSLRGLSKVAWFQGDPQQAAAFAKESLALDQNANNKSGMVYGLEWLALLAIEQRQADRAVRLCAAAEREREFFRLPILPAYREEYASITTKARAQLDEATFVAAWEEGSAMTLEQAVAEAEQMMVAQETTFTAVSPIIAPHHPNALTPRELEVLRLVAQGLSDAQIAEKLVISRRTVNTHLTSIYNKLGVNSRTGATRHALDHKLI